MPSGQTIKLMLAAAALFGVAIIVSATVDSGTTAAPQTPIVRQILRRKDVRALPAAASEIAELRRKAQNQEKRNLKIREFKDMPLKVETIRNVDSETWYKDLEIEVKNVCAKPIYGILAFLEFPDHKPGGRDIAMVVSYGDPKYWDIDVLADSKDPHLDPGQNYVFTIQAKDARVLQRKHERAPQEFKKLDFHFTIINFGDGTGFQATTPIDVRKTKQPNGTGSKEHRGKKISRVRAPAQDGCGSCGRYSTPAAPTCL